MHVAVDDASRWAFVEVLPDERARTAAAFLTRVVATFAAQGIPVQRVLTDDGACYRAHAFAQTARQLGVRPKRTCPNRPQTNGKAEAFIRTLLREWAYVRPYLSNAARLTALPPWLAAYNHARPHTGLDGRTRHSDSLSTTSVGRTTRRKGQLAAESFAAPSEYGGSRLSTSFNEMCS